MKKTISKLKLTQLSKADLESRQMNALKGGRACGCVCGGCLCSGDMYECERDDCYEGDIEADKNAQIKDGGEGCSWNWPLSGY